MKIDLSIYNRILYDDLRPWLDRNKSEEKFSRKLTKQFMFPVGGSVAFDKAISNALSEFKTFSEEEDYFFEIKDDNKKFQALPDEIFEPLIEIHLPEPPTKKAEFYFFLIKHEGTRLINNLHKAVQIAVTENEKKYCLTSALSKVNSFLNDIEKQKKQLQKTQAAAQQKNNEFIFLVLKYTLIRLHLEMKEVFETLLSSKTFDENGIFQNILKEKAPANSIIKDNAGMIAYRVKRYINFEKYSKQRTQDLKNEALETIVKYFSGTTISKDAANRKAVLAEAIQALENIYFVNEFSNPETRTTYENLIDESFAETVFTKAVADINEKIESHNTGAKQLPVIAKEELQLSFLQAKIPVDESVFTLSIPRKVLQMLHIAKAAANANLTVDLSKIAEGKAQRIKTNLSVPQVALLFKALTELNPKIFDIKAEAELLRFISANFITKKSGDEGISIDKLRILFNQPDSKAAEFWYEKFSALMATAKKFK